MCVCVCVCVCVCGVELYIQLDGAEIARQLSQRGFDVPGILSMYLFVSIYACMYV